MSTILNIEEPRLGASTLHRQIKVTNGLKGVSVTTVTTVDVSQAEKGTEVQTNYLNLTADEAEDLALALNNHAAQVRNGIHGNDAGAL